MRISLENKDSREKILAAAVVFRLFLYALSTAPVLADVVSFA